MSAREELLAALAVKRRQPIGVELEGLPRQYMRRMTPAMVDAMSAAGTSTMPIAKQLAYLLCNAEGALLFDASKDEDVDAISDGFDADDILTLLKASRPTTPQKDGAVKDPGNSITGSDSSSISVKH